MALCRAEKRRSLSSLYLNRNKVYYHDPVPVKTTRGNADIPGCSIQIAHKDHHCWNQLSPKSGIYLTHDETQIRHFLPKIPDIYAQNKGASQVIEHMKEIDKKLDFSRIEDAIYRIKSKKTKRRDITNWTIEKIEE